MDPVIYPVGILVANLVGSAIRAYEVGQHPTRQNEAYQKRIEELELSHQQRIKEQAHGSKLNSDQKKLEIIFAETVRSKYAIENNVAIRRDAKSDENSPFIDSSDATYEALRKNYQETGKPIVLLAPFWDDKRTKKVNEEGGFVDFRTAFNFRYAKSSWSEMASKQDGYFKRPLTQTNRDVNLILSALPDIPIILVYGTIQGTHGTVQAIQRIHPSIAFWNIFPGQPNTCQTIQLEFFLHEPPLDNIKAIPQYSFDLQDLVGDYLSKIIGIASTTYELYTNRTDPNLKQFGITDRLELEILTLQMVSVYDILGKKYPENSVYYQRKKKIILSELNISEKNTNDVFIKDRDYNKAEFSATDVRPWFANALTKMANTLIEAEEQGCRQGASGELALGAFIEDLSNEIQKLNNGKFYFLLLGDFNRGKSSVLNVLLGEELLPVGATATTLIPTFIKYGKHKKVNVHFKDGSIEELEPQEYKEKYVRNSKSLKDKIKKFFNSSFENFLITLSHSEFYYPLELLSKGVEFIDTAGLNHTEEENEQTFSYMNICHGIIFLLSADIQVTKEEKRYLTNYIKDKVGTVFFLINKWDNISDEDRENICDTFVIELSDSLGKSENEIESMWGERIFNVYAKNALERLKNNQSLEGTGFSEFNNKLDYFLINERLISELYPSISITRNVAEAVNTKVEDTLLVLNDDVQGLEQKIKDVTPHLKFMKRIVKSLVKEINEKSQSCGLTVSQSYKNYFLERVNNFEREFTMPVLDGLSEEKCKKYIDKLTGEFTKHQQEKLTDWNEISQAHITTVSYELINFLNQENTEYETERKHAKDILSKNNNSIEIQKELLKYQADSANKVDLTIVNASATGKMITTGSLGGIGTIASGAGTVAVSNALFHTAIGLFLQNSAGAIVALTPAGWVVAGVSVVVGGAMALRARSTEINKFQQGMQQQLKESLKKAVDEEKISAINNHVQSLFSGFEQNTKQLSDDVNSLEESLNNLLASKKNSETNYEAEANRLNKLSQDISSQWEAINAEYGRIANIQS